VLLADGHSVVRDALRCLLHAESDIRVVGLARNGQEALKEARRLAPRVVVMDASMPLMDGMEAARQLHEAKPEIAVVFLAAEDSSDRVQAALEAGARGYLTRDCGGPELVKAIRAVASGKRYFGKGVAERLFEHIGGSRAPGAGALSTRERDIVRLVAGGHSNAAAARQLGLSARTVETYRIRIMRKLGLEGVPALVKFAIRNGLATLD
jgi:DNA-binding NarL/FixJ family response regulator